MTSDLRDLLLLVYTPREDSTARKYDDWLRDIDNPFFNGVPGIQHYTNWKITSPADCAVPYTYFDLMYVEDKNKLDDIWGNPDVEKFAQGWTDSWGRYPAATPETMDKNYQVYLCEMTSGDLMTPWQPATFMTAQSAVSEAQGRRTFKILDTVLGDQRFSHFAMQPLNNTSEFTAAAAVRPSECYGCALGELVASPDSQG